MIGQQPHQETFDDEDLSRLEDAFAAEPATGPAPTRMPVEAGRMPLEAGDPRRVGRYRLTARLGSGGMGVVYLGVADDGRLVAVKLLRPELADHQESRARFGREMAVLTRVRGAGIVRVIEAATEGGRPFLATEYAAGPTLAQYVESAGPLEAGMLYGLAAGLAEALAAIHGAGVVHRDLKPGNVILAADGPKVIDFGIAQVLDSAALTLTGMTIGTTGYMAPEQVTGPAGPAADVFAWAVTLAFAASGQPPFGTGPTDAVVYRILHAQPSIAAVPEGLQPMVAAALAKDPWQRPAAHEIADRLAAVSARPGPTGLGPAGLGSAGLGSAGLGPAGLGPAGLGPAYAEAGTALLATCPVPPVALPLTWLPTESWASGPEPTGSNTEAALASAGRRPGVRKRLAGRWNVVPVAALVLAGATALALTVTGHATPSRLGNAASARPAVTLATYPGQQARDVVQTIERIVGSGNTIVTIGSQTSDGLVRQQFIVSHDGGKSWQLAQTHAAGGGQAPLGYAAIRLAGGPGGWLAVGAQAIWTSRNGLSWTLAARHGITPWQPGDNLLVLNSTAQGYIAAGLAPAGRGQTRAVIWTSRNGLTWQRETAAQLGLAGPGETVQAISYATSFGPDTVISGAVAKDGTTYSGVWLSTNGGSTWTRVNVPAGHGAGTSIAGLGADASGLIAIRAGRSPSGTQDGVAYFSPNGRSWQYAATITAPGGWTPKLVKGSDDGFVVTGNGSRQILPFTSTGTGTAWQQTASLGPDGQTLSGVTVGASGTVIAVGNTVSQQALFDEATTAGVRPVSLASIPGALIPEAAVKSVAAAGGQQIAVGSADGYPAIWRKAAGSAHWTLVSSLPLASAGAGPAVLYSVTHGAHGWLAVGLTGPVRAASPLVYTSANGISWQVAPGSIAGKLASVAGHVAAVSAAYGPLGYVIVGTSLEPAGGCASNVWFSSDLIHWTRAHDVNDTGGSSTVLTLTADDDGFYSVGSHDSQPAVWTTANGTAWTTTPLTTGADNARLEYIATDDDTIVALGQQTTAGVTTPLEEVSTNDGQTWRQVPFTPALPGATVTALTQDAGGFTAAVQSGTDTTIWASADGTTWTQVQARGLTGAGTHQLAALAQSGNTVTGIGSTATQQSWQPVFLGLPAR